ncbi:MAG TPA: hypothetical protein IAB06_01555 [Candidatus Avacidaminococcus intestinavium]|uniref:Surface-adhesin protein E-like domain-containing protein n=1 Tax=Candidatus Avacidaminococcus intestinavium TaxID=2840684 RepID=A0A9D1SL55_9FIRM|nr:hypothetical protein [Candidatus Avacidaminococcus intestinavium]
MKIIISFIAALILFFTNYTYAQMPNHDWQLITENAETRIYIDPLNIKKTNDYAFSVWIKLELKDDLQINRMKKYNLSEPVKYMLVQNEYNFRNREIKTLHFSNYGLSDNRLTPEPPDDQTVRPIIPGSIGGTTFRISYNIYRGITKTEQKKANTEIIKSLRYFNKTVNTTTGIESYSQPDTSSTKPIFWGVKITKAGAIYQNIHLSFPSSKISFENTTFTFSNAKEAWLFDANTYHLPNTILQTFVFFNADNISVTIPINVLIKGLNILTSGSNPIITLNLGKEKIPLKLTFDDIINLKKALVFANNAEIINFTLTL